MFIWIYDLFMTIFFPKKIKLFVKKENPYQNYHMYDSFDKLLNNDIAPIEPIEPIGPIPTGTTLDENVNTGMSVIDSIAHYTPDDSISIDQDSIVIDYDRDGYIINGNFIPKEEIQDYGIFKIIKYFHKKC